MIPQENVNLLIENFPRPGGILCRDTPIDAAIFRQWMMVWGRSKAGNPNIVSELMAGKKVGDQNFKVHLDGYISSICLDIPACLSRAGRSASLARPRLPHWEIQAACAWATSRKIMSSRASAPQIF
jgi:hypothetical protein